MHGRKASKVVIRVSNDFIFYSMKASREIIDGYFVPSCPESIELFIEDQAFSPYDLAIPQPLIPTTCCRVVSWTKKLLRHQSLNVVFTGVLCLWGGVAIL